jgi:hypothetical protein
MANHVMITTHGDERFPSYSIDDCTHFELTESDPAAKALGIVPDTLILLNHGILRKASTSIFDKEEKNMIGGAHWFASAIAHRVSIPKFADWKGKVKTRLVLFGCSVAASTPSFEVVLQNGSKFTLDGNGPAYCQALADAVGVPVHASDKVLRAPRNFFSDEIDDFVGSLNKVFSPRLPSSGSRAE